jgi:hypothetical protein
MENAATNITDRPGPLFALNDPVLDDPDRVDEGLKGLLVEDCSSNDLTG